MFINIYICKYYTYIRSPVSGTKSTPKPRPSAFIPTVRRTTQRSPQPRRSESQQVPNMSTVDVVDVCFYLYC